MNILKRKYLKTYLALVLFLVCIIPSQAVRRHYGRGKLPAFVDIQGGAGAVFMPYNTGSAPISVLAGANMDLSVSYGLLFNSRTGWGMNLGFGFATFQGSRVLSGSYFHDGIVDDSMIPEAYELKSQLNDWYETQSAFYAKIPINIFYQTNNYGRGAGTNYYVMGGFNFYVPLSGKFSVQSGELINSAFYLGHGGRDKHGNFNPETSNPDELGMVISDLPNHGFGKFNTALPSGDVETQFFTTFRLELGIRFAVQEARFPNEFFVSAFFEHGFNNMMPSAKGVPLFNSPSSYNGLFSSGVTDSTVPVMFGLKIGYRFTDVHSCNCIGR